MTLKVVDSASPVEGGVNQPPSPEALLHALLEPFGQKKEVEEFSSQTLEIFTLWMSLSETGKRECLRRLIKTVNQEDCFKRSLTTAREAS